MTWIVLAAASLLLTITYGLVVKDTLSDKKADYDPIAYASAIFIIVGIIFAIIWIFSGKISSDILSISNPYVFKLTVLSMIIYTIAPSFYYRALKKLPFSVITIIYSSVGLFALLIGLLFKLNSFYLTSLFGSSLIVVSVVMVSFKGTELKSNRYLLYMFLATFFYALGATVDSQLIPHYSTVFYAMITFGVPGILILLNFLSPKKLIQPYKKENIRSVITSGSVMGASLFCVFESYRAGGTSSQVYSILAMEAILSVIFAAIFLKERKDLFLKIMAAIIAGIGVFFLTR